MPWRGVWMVDEVLPSWEQKPEKDTVEAISSVLCSWRPEWLVGEARAVWHSQIQYSNCVLLKSTCLCTFVLSMNHFCRVVVGLLSWWDVGERGPRMNCRSSHCTWSWACSWSSCPSQTSSATLVHLPNPNRGEDLECAFQSPNARHTLLRRFL